jgi:hypothetical protein
MFYRYRACAPLSQSYGIRLRQAVCEFPRMEFGANWVAANLLRRRPALRV